ncbi:unnamed protein product [Paramecium primaurelia]|uniref:Uncharacterized protein n=2 Tax=Paramecium TaxID=5884 RepID=A0A8S1MV96_PARPR|nr:unnamed protein product [Paramecium primaurelia]
MYRKNQSGGQKSVQNLFILIILQEQGQQSMIHLSITFQVFQLQQLKKPIIIVSSLKNLLIIANEKYRKQLKKNSQLFFNTNCLNQILQFQSIQLYFDEYGFRQVSIFCQKLYQKRDYHIVVWYKYKWIFLLQNNILIKLTQSMGSCSSKKLQTHHTLALNSQTTCAQVHSRMTWADKCLQQPKERIIQPYNPNSLQYQYNVEVEGVIFDIIAPPDLLDDDNLEPFEEE